MVDSISGGKPASPRPLEPRNAAPRAVGDTPAASVVRHLAGGAEPLSASRLEARGLVRDMAARPPVDAARVESLKAAIDSGSYRLDLGKLADAMIRSEGPPRA